MSAPRGSVIGGAIYYLYNSFYLFILFRLFASSCLLFVNFTVDVAGPHQLVVCSRSGYTAAFHYDYKIGIHYRAYALGNNELGCFRNIFFEFRTYKSVCLSVYGACRVVEYQNFWSSEKCAGYAEPLFLSSGYVCSALLYKGVVTVGKAFTKLSA